MAIMTIEYGIDSVEIIGFTFRDGHRSGQNGSALDIFADSKVTIDNCIFINNYAESLPDAWGGTIVVGGGTQTNVLIKNTLIKQNTADNGGGAGIRIGGNDIPVTMRRVLIVNNQGTAIHVDNGSLRVLNGTIVGNIGGILLNEYSNGEIINTILMENFPEPAISLENGSSASVTYSNVEGGYTGIGNMNANPLFVDEENGDYHLLIDSPCIDTGHPDLDGDGITWENDLDDQDPDGTRMDMGAFFYPHFLTNTAISSNPDTLSILNPMDTIVVTFSVPFDPTTVVSNIEVNSSEYGSFPYEISVSDDSRNIYISPNTKYPLSDIIYITLKQGIISSEGYAFDYNSDGLLSDYNLKFMTPWLGDYNSDFSVNFDDFIIFRDTWWERDQLDVTPFELHPYFGTPPFVILQPDSNFAYDDLMTFIWMWNWSHVQSSNTTFTLGQKVASTDSRIKFTHYYSNYDPWRQNLSIPIELELTIDNPETVSSVEIILSYNQNELVFNDIKYASSVDCNDCDWINLEYNTEKSSQLIINMVAFNKDRLLQPGANLLNSINFKAHVQDSTTIRYYYDIRYYGEKSVNQDVGSGKYTLKIVNPRPEGFTLLPNFPNPFNPVTTIKYNLPEQTMVRLTIFDILGRQVRTLVNQQQEPGFKSIQWNARDDFGRSVGAGVYIYRIEAGDFHKTNKMILMK